jgi:glycine cleavage system P protein (glycine dehydrogenase) subunit 2
MFKSAVYSEPFLKNLSTEISEKPKKIIQIPDNLKRSSPLNLPNVDETQIVRHFHHLSQMNFGVDTGIYPLGSCTMKYNPRINEIISSWDNFSCIHPYQDESTVQGTLQMMYELEQMLMEISGMDAFSLQPAAGAHGEFLGMLLTKAYHKDNKQDCRTNVILPDTAHGTNPASAAMAGFNIVEIPSTADGTVDVSLLEESVDENTACFMLTNPNTLGIFETDITEIKKIVHKAGALLYYDGANMNAIMGKARPGDMGFDIVHLNLHKTFSTPHGGGGPGSGPVGVKKTLEKYLPFPRVIKKDDAFHLSYDYPSSIGKLKQFYGNTSVLLKAYIYIKMMGGNGLKEASEIAVLNANYMKDKICKNALYDLPYRNLRKHEFVLSCSSLLNKKGIRAMDVAKRLLDNGLHPPTVYFPLVVKEALMIEPTESESKQDLDRYISTLCSIANEDVEKIKNAPSHTPVSRIDEVGATKNPIFTWNDIEKND